MKLITAIVFYFLVISTINCQKIVVFSSDSAIYLADVDMYKASYNGTDTTGTVPLNLLETDYYNVEKVLIYSDKVEVFYFNSFIGATDSNLERFKVIYRLENGKLRLFKKIFATYIPAKYEYKE